MTKIFDIFDFFNHYLKDVKKKLNEMDWFNVTTKEYDEGVMVKLEIMPYTDSQNYIPFSIYNRLHFAMQYDFVDFYSATFRPSEGVERVKQTLFFFFPYGYSDYPRDRSYAGDEFYELVWDEFDATDYDCRMWFNGDRQEVNT